jgi:hypothetical protein
MIRREKIAYSIVLVVIIGLAWTVVNFYVMNNSHDTFLMQEQNKILASYALTVDTQARNLVNSFLRYYDYTKGDQNTPNITEDFLGDLEWRSFILLGDEAHSARYAIETDEFYLMGFHLNHAGNYSEFVNVYSNISETVNYAVNLLDWTISGRSPSEHRRVMLELCHILGADRNATSDTTQLITISETFSRIHSLCWNSANQFQPKQPVIDAELTWALGNATQLYQNLVTLHNSNPPVGF